ncbi:MAG: hypothetical protein JWQ53_2333 [Klenkia sp.]|nr:hypothetical protein [Klenkia sp.]
MADGGLAPFYTWQDARRAGLTRAQLRDDGIRVTRGSYVSRAQPLTLDAACHAVARVVPGSAAFSHLTAAALWGAPVTTAGPLQLVVPRGVVPPRRRRLSVTVRTLGVDDVREHRGLRLTSPARTWLDLCAGGAAGELVVVGDALLRTGHLDRAELAGRLDRAAGSPGVVLARRVAPVLHPGAASRPESLLRWTLVDSPLPDPEVQVPVQDRWGRVAVHGDLGYPRWKVLVEYEGRQHAGRDQFRRDVDRYSLTAADGWLVLRFADVHLDRPGVVVDRVGRALLSRGARW